MRVWLALGAISIAVAAAGCGSSANQVVLVSAAASLTDAFNEIEVVFENRNPDVDVVINFGGSSALREQILAGAPADVFASANQANMDTVVNAGLADAPIVFAHNRMQIAVPLGNPGGITGLEDFGTPGLVLGLCAEAVPCGELARVALDNAGVVPDVDTDEPNVRALLTKIEAGELDGGIVYQTDVAAAEVEVIEIPAAMNVVADYSIAILDEARLPEAGRFVAFVLSDVGRGVLADHGFAP